MFLSKGYSNAFYTGASPKLSCVVKASRAFIQKKLTLAALEWSGNIAGGHLRQVHTRERGRPGDHSVSKTI